MTVRSAVTDEGDILDDIAESVATGVGEAPERILDVITQLRWRPSHADALLGYLREHPDALTSGAADGPAALRKLLEVLAEEYAVVQRMRCGRCHSERRLPYRWDGVSICGACYRRVHVDVCTQCGETRPVGRRIRTGAVCERCNAGDRSHWRACARCNTVTRVAFRIAGQPVCQKCGPFKRYTCSSCGREEQRAAAMTPQGPICKTCYRRGRRHECVQCGRLTVNARLADPATRTWICRRCWVPPTATCIECGQEKRCDRGMTTGQPICNTCRSRRRKPKPCAVCERSVAIRTTLPLGQVCGPCYRRIRLNPGTCARCGELRPLVAGQDDEKVCGPCSGDHRNWTCTRCGQVDLLVDKDLCVACTVCDRLTALLTGPDGKIPEQLNGVTTLLLEINSAEQTQEILNGSKWIQLLGSLVEEGTLITHDRLDQLAQDLTVGYLRNTLVQTGALDDRIDGLEAIDPWLTSLLSDTTADIAAVLRPYAAWSVLPRARRRAARGLLAPATPKYVRTRIETAKQFLHWLRDNNIRLDALTQHDVDTWLIQGASTRRRIRDFLQWTHAQAVTAGLEVKPLAREGLAADILGDAERWSILRRCFHDDAIPLRLRVAGALLLLYGQIPTKLVELTIDDLSRDGPHAYLALHQHPVILPAALATLINDLARLNTATCATPRHAHLRPWLFPGARLGSHLTGGRLTTLLNKELGISIRSGRGSALSTLAGDLPAPVLADLLGLSITAAGRWGAVAARDSAYYVEARTHDHGIGVDVGPASMAMPMNDSKRPAPSLPSRTGASPNSKHG